MECTINSNCRTSISPQRQKQSKSTTVKRERRKSLKMSSTAGQVIHCKGILESTFFSSFLYWGNEMIVKEEFKITWPIGNWGICTYIY